MENHVSSDHGFIPEKPRNYNNKSNNKSSTVTFNKLPTMKKKASYVGRVGISAEKRKSLSTDELIE